MSMPLLEIIFFKKKSNLKKSQISQNLIHFKQLAYTLQLKIYASTCSHKRNYLEGVHLKQSIYA